METKIVPRRGNGKSREQLRQIFRELAVEFVKANGSLKHWVKTREDYINKKTGE